MNVVRSVKEALIPNKLSMFDVERVYIKQSSELSDVNSSTVCIITSKENSVDDEENLWVALKQLSSSRQRKHRRQVVESSVQSEEDVKDMSEKRKEEKY